MNFDSFKWNHEAFLQRYNKVKEKFSSTLEKFSSRTDPYRHIFFSRGGQYLIFSIFLLLCVLFVLRQCGAAKRHQPEFFSIGQDPLWTNAPLMGKERPIAAFSGDLLTNIAKSQKVNITLTSLSGNNLQDSLRAGKIDGMLSAIPTTPTNLHLYYFSDTYFPLGPVLITPRDRTLPMGLNTEGRKIIGVPSNIPDMLGLDKVLTVQLKPYDSIIPALSDLDANNIDGIIFPVIPAYIYTNAFYSKQAKIATPPLTDDGLRLVTLQTAKGKELIGIFNAGLQKAKETGNYDELLNKWGLFDPYKVEK